MAANASDRKNSSMPTGTRLNATIFVLAQFLSRFAHTLVGTAVKYELLEVGGASRFAMSQVANNVVRMFISQVAGLLADQFPRKRLYILVEVVNLLLLLGLTAPYFFSGSPTAGLLFGVNIGLGLTLSFSQPVVKSMPSMVARKEDLAMVNNWDLTGDKVGRYLAPMAFTLVSSIFSFYLAMLFTFALFVMTLIGKVCVTVADELDERGREQGAQRATGKLIAIFMKLRSGLRTIQGVVGLLVLNTLLTNIFIYPLNSVVFPILLKRLAPDTMSSSIAGAALVSLQHRLGIQKSKAWMNYAALISLGGVIGPFLSSLLVMLLESVATVDADSRTWRGIRWSLIGQTLSGSLVGLAILFGSFDTGLFVLSLLLCWTLMVAANNTFTIYLNSHTQTVLDRKEQGRFIANIMTLFNFGNSVGTLLFGLAMGDETSDVLPALGLLAACLLLRGGIFMFLSWRGSGAMVGVSEPSKIE